MSFAGLLKEVQDHLAEVSKNPSISLDQGLLEKFDVFVNGMLPQVSCYF